jgi:hypothetical protein
LSGGVFVGGALDFGEFVDAFCPEISVEMWHKGGRYLIGKNLSHRTDRE